jgi:hypothetical protein
MAKFFDQFAVHRPVQRRNWKVKRIAVLVFLACVLAPFLMEGVALFCSQWAEVIGVRFVVKTPLLDWSWSKLEDCRQLIDESMSYHFQTASWEPGFVFPILALVIVIAMLMLRR